MKKIDIALLTCGNKNFLEKSLGSILKQADRIRTLYIYNDSETSIKKYISAYTSGKICFRILENLTKKRLGQWQAFKKIVSTMPSRVCFGILHDDDWLLPEYSKEISGYLQSHKEDFVASFAIIESTCEDLCKPVNPVLAVPREFHSSRELGEFYLQSFLPFPGTFFRLQKKDLINRLRPEYREMADAVLLILLADIVPVRFLPHHLYVYRRHSNQVSHSMDHQMQDLFHKMILKLGWKPKDKKIIQQRLGKITTERYFQAVWETGTFRGHQFDKNINILHALRSLRNRKIKFLQICLREMWNSVLKKTKFCGAPKIIQSRLSEKNPLLIIIFSLDRANQCDGLLRSIQNKLRISKKIVVLWKASTKQHFKAYQIAKKNHKNICWIKEKKFRDNLLSLVSKKYKLVMFCTDDAVFINYCNEIPLPSEWSSTAGVSLRLGENCSYSHPADQKYCLPLRLRFPSALLWKPCSAKGDFHVTFSVDATIYPRIRIAKLLNKTMFNNPNTLEDEISKKYEKKYPWMVGLRQSAYVSNPLNRVNLSHLNRCGCDYLISTQKLADLFIKGRRIDLDKTYKKVPLGPHEEFDLKMETFTP